MLTARWDITNACNLNCIHCRSEEFYSNQSHASPNYDEVMAMLDQLVRCGVNRIVLLGGEPFAYRHIFDVIARAVDLQLQVCITTNGTLIDSKAAQRLVDMGVTSISISLDGSSAEINDPIRGPGTFQQAWNTLAMIVSAKAHKSVDNPCSEVAIGVSTVLTRRNLNDIYTLANNALLLGIDHFRVGPLDEMGNARDHINNLRVSAKEKLQVAEQLMRLVEKYPKVDFSILDLKPLVLEYLYKKTLVPMPIHVSGCRACTNEIYIQPDGTVSPCLSTARQSWLVSEGKVVDNLLSLEDLSFLETGTLFSKFQQEFPRNVETYTSYNPCGRCTYAGNLCRPCPLGEVAPTAKQNEMCLLAESLLSQSSKEKPHESVSDRRSK